jgi:hypothetical protein
MDWSQKRNKQQEEAVTRYWNAAEAELPSVKSGVLTLERHDELRKTELDYFNDKTQGGDPVKHMAYLEDRAITNRGFKEMSSEDAGTRQRTEQWKETLAELYVTNGVAADRAAASSMVTKCCDRMPELYKQAQLSRSGR